MHALRRDCATIAIADSSVMLIGESGVGKELVAKFIHSQSSRSMQAFIAVNCSAIPPELFESEFFGYRPGAFTGASAKGKPGLLRMPTAEPCFWMSWVNCRLPCSQSFCVSRKAENSIRLEAPRVKKSMYGSSLQLIAT